MTKINFVALGGMSEIGRKMYLLEVENDIYVFDAGMKYPEDTLFGIDKVIPDMTYLRNNRKRIRGVFVSNVAERNVGSMKELMSFVEAPVYCTAFTAAMLKKEIKDKNQRYIEIEPMKKLKIGGNLVYAFHTTYSIPHSLGFVVETSQGNIVYVSDYVFNQNVPLAYQTDMGALVQVAQKPVLALISSAKGAEQSGYAANQHTFRAKLLPAIRQAEGAVFISIFTHNFLNIQEIIRVAEDTKRKICFVGKKGYDMYTQAIKSKELLMSEGMLLNITKTAACREQVIFIVVGDEGVPYDLMLQILSDTKREILVKPTDTVIVAVPKIAGSELKSSEVVDVLFQKGIPTKIIDPTCLATDIPAQEDIKMLYNLLKPKYMIPCDAEYRQMIEFQNTLLRHGLHERQIKFLDNGEWLAFEQSKATKSEKTNLKLEDILVDGDLEEDTDNIVLKEREQLSADGVAILTVSLLEKNDTYETMYVYFDSKGFIPQKDQKPLIAEMNKTVKAEVDKANKQSDGVKLNVLKKRIQEQAGQTIYRKIKRYPIIVVQFVMQK